MLKINQNFINITIYSILNHLYCSKKYNNCLKNCDIRINALCIKLKILLYNILIFVMVTIIYMYFTNNK